MTDLSLRPGRYLREVPDSANGTSWAELRANVADPVNYDRGHYVGPPVYMGPAKEDATCSCARRDDLGRPVFVGCCPDVDCQRRSR